MRTTHSALSSRPPNPAVRSMDGVLQLASNTVSWTLTWNAWISQEPFRLLPSKDELEAQDRSWEGVQSFSMISVSFLQHSFVDKF